MSTGIPTNMADPVQRKYNVSYTDGSSTRHGFGAGTVLRWDSRNVAQRVIPLGELSSVYSAEVFAIYVTCLMVADVLDDRQEVHRHEDLKKTIREEGIVIY